MFSTEEKADAADIDSPMDAFLGVDCAVIILEHDLERFVDDDRDERCFVVTKAHDDGDDVIRDTGSLPISSVCGDDEDRR